MKKFVKITNDILVAYLDNESRESERIYIETHPDEFAERLAELRSAENMLQDRLRGFRPISTFALGQYHLGIGSTESKARISTYLALHPHASKTVELLDSYLAALTPAPLAQERTNLLTQARIIIARLMGGDSATGAMALGLRGEQEGIYAAGDQQIIIDTDSDFDDPTKFALTGLLTDYDQSNALKVQLWQADTQRLITTTALDEFGNFGFSCLDTGHYELIISGEKAVVEIHIQDIAI